jgi:hypothetical protein
MTKKRRTYQPRIVGGQVMMPADLKRPTAGSDRSARRSLLRARF